MKVRFTEHSGQARVFAKRPTAKKWADASKGKVMKIIGIGYVVYHNKNGWVK